ncbi:immunoglobulin domain-containing protein [Pelagicoccus enzymogenes]|uniref:immunoglobulin domain-containing protein n=1 Tax=Pelagicoccus enzymogenes TaxID=2773457 RepID=UPI00280E2CCA|nr:immunoglobulin domain-containing protein [Pelagicoccus enzymogenes]MDQ8196838.1 immunoglobulin domain-containing protein [Pelagicoccus enzymogenes]
MRIPLPPKTFRLISLITLAPYFQGLAETYRLSENFELESRQDAIPSQLIALEDGSHLAVGGFDSVDGEFSGSLAILSPEGNFEPLSLSFPILEAQADQAALNSDGSISISFTNVAPELGLNGNTVIQFSPNGEPVLTIANQQGLILQKDNRFLQIVGETDPSQPGKQFTRIQRLVRSETGDYVLDESFKAPRVEGYCRAVHILANGKILAVGAFPNSSTLTTGNLMLLEPNGQAAPGFSRYGYRNEQLEYNQYHISSLPTGEIFLLYESGDQYFPTKIGADGKRDSSFGVSNQASVYYKSEVFSAGDGGYFVTGAWNQIGNDFTQVIKLKADGQIDEAFNFDPDGIFTDDGPIDYFSAAMTQNGLLLSGRTSSDSKKIAFAFLSENGALAEAHPSKISISKPKAASWTNSGELLMGDGIARIDGTIRVSFEPVNNLKLTQLADGTFTTDDFLFYDQNRTRLPVQPHFDPSLWFRAQMPNGEWLAEQRASKWGQEIGVVKLLPHGSVDESFPTLDPDTAILCVTKQHIYYTLGKWANIPREVRRMSQLGAPDPDFSIPNLYGNLAFMKVVGDWLYFPSLTIGDNQIAKPLGARFSINGELDQNYAPEKFIERPYQSANTWPSQSANRYADDGSTVIFGYKIDQPSESGSERLWHVSPEGVVTEVDDRFKWKNTEVDIAPNGDLYLAGTALTPIGPLPTSARYTRSPASFSTPFKKRVSFSEGPVSLEVTIVDFLPDSIVWLKDGTEIPGANAPQLDFDHLDASHAGTYQIRIQREDTTITSNPIRLLPPKAPHFLTHPHDSDASSFGSLILKASVDGAHYPELQWYVDGLPIEGANTPVLEFDEIGLQDIGTYRLRSKNSIGTQWSKPAIVSVNDIVPQIEKKFDVGRESPLYASSIIPSPNGGYYIQSLEDSLPPIRKIGTDYVNEEGEMTIDWSKDRIPAGYDSLNFCPFTGTPFALLTEFVPGGSGDTITHFTRLTPQGMPDTAFGVHRFDSNMYSVIAFRQWPDGNVWVDDGSTALEISNSGTVTPLPRIEQFVGGMPPWTFIHPLSMRLADGTYTLIRPNSHWLIRLGADGKSLPGSDIIDIGYSPLVTQILGIWANGTQLKHDPVAQTLSGSTFEGEELWNLNITGWTIPTNNIFAVKSADGTRLSIIAHAELDPKSARIFWVESDGTNNFHDSKTFDGLHSYRQIVGLKNNAFALHGLADPQGTKERVVFINSDSNPSEPTKLVRLETAYLGEPTAALDGQNLFLPITGEHVDGTLTGPILKLDAAGNLDSSYFASLPESALPATKALCPLPQGYLAVLRGENYGYEYELHVLDPVGNPVSYRDLGTIYQSPPKLIYHPYSNTGFLVVSIEPNSGESVRFDRYLIDGTLDPDYQHGVKKVQNNYTMVTSDSLGRVYLYRRQFNQTPAAVIRVNANGEVDNSFTLDPSLSQIEAIAIDRSDRPLIAGTQLLRLSNNGTIAPGFAVQIDAISASDQFGELPNGDVIVRNKRFDQNGVFVRSYGVSSRTLSGTLFNERVATVTYDPQTSQSSLHLISLSGPPKIQNQPRGQSVPIGFPLTFAINASEKPGLNYQWTHNGNLIPQETSSRLSFNSVQAENAGSYQVTVSWDEGSLTLPKFELITTTATPYGQNVPPLSFQLTEAGIEYSWVNEIEQSFELVISEDLKAWQIAPFPSSAEQRTQKAIAQFKDLPPNFFVKLWISP